MMKLKLLLESDPNLLRAQQILFGPFRRFMRVICNPINVSSPLLFVAFPCEKFRLRLWNVGMVAIAISL